MPFLPSALYPSSIFSLFKDCTSYSRAQHIEWLKLNQIHVKQITTMQANTKKIHVFHIRPTLSVASRSRYQSLMLKLITHKLRELFRRWAVSLSNSHHHHYIRFHLKNFTLFFVFIVYFCHFVSGCACENFLHFVQQFKFYSNVVNEKFPNNVWTCVHACAHACALCSFRFWYVIFCFPAPTSQ